MKYLCLVYADEAVLDGMSQGDRDTLVDESLANDEELREAGHLVLAQALEHVEAATTVEAAFQAVEARAGLDQGDVAAFHRVLRALEEAAA